MSDPPQPPPPKPKPGSLRDRIAAFEKPNAAAAASPTRPPVRPKPGNVSWKPSPPSPTSSAGNTPTPENDEQKRGGMSASDAKESIGRGGSLKERMAALQGKGAFGGGPPVAPPPVGPKPVKRPPLVVPTVSSEERESHEDEHEQEKSREEPKSVEERHEGDVPKTTKPVEDAALSEENKEEIVEEEQDEETKERERRAAIAARMARLGGARVGMGPPPIFGKKPEVKPKPKEVREAKEERNEESVSPQKDEISEPEVARRNSAASAVSTTSGEKSTSLHEVKEDLIPETPQLTTSDEVSPKDSDMEVLQSSPPKTHPTPETRPSLDSTSSQSSVSTSRSPPTSMPLPAAPRRAGPPRSRSARNIKTQAAKQDDEVTTLLPADSRAEAAVAPTPVVDAGAEVLATEESAQQQPVLTSDYSVIEDKVEKEQKPVIEESKDVVPASLALDEGSSETERQKTPGDVPHLDNQEKVSYVPTVPQEDDEAPPKPRPEVKTPFSPVVLQERDGAETRTESSVEPIAEPNDSPTITNALSPEEQIQPTASSFDENRTDLTAAESTAASTNLDYSTPTHIAEPKTPGPSNHPGSTTVESEESRVAKDETENEDEDTRRKRIAERMAKMGGRNPFTSGSSTGSAILGRKTSVEQSQPTTALDQELQSPQRDNNDDDISLEQEVIAGSAAASEAFETTKLGPRVTRMADAHRVEADLPPGLDEAPVEEHEEAVSELKIPPEPLASDEHTSSVSLSEVSQLVEESDDMAPPRIARAIPPLPSQTYVENVSVSPTTTESKRVSLRRSLPPLPPPQEPTPMMLESDGNKLATFHKEEEEGVSVGSGTTPPSNSIPPLAAEELQEDEEIKSSSVSPTSKVSIPSQTAPDVSKIPATQSPTSAASEVSRKSIPPPVPRAISPISPRRAVSPPARPPPVSPSSTPLSPQGDTVASPTASVRRSIPPPRRTPSNPAEESTNTQPARRSSQISNEPIPAAKRSSSPFVRDVIADPVDPTTTTNQGPIAEQEVLDDSEPDPIDPSFYSPPRSPVVVGRPRSQGPLTLQLDSGDQADEDDEQARRRTIAERMAKLGGIKFGAPPPIPHKPPVSVPETSTKQVAESEGKTETMSEEPPEPDSEEAEKARRQAISARLAGMGGMRFGMLPQVSKPVHPRVSSDDSARTVEAPPSRQAPSSPSHETQASDADLESEDGVKVEAESELSLEEVTAEDAMEKPEESPPPVPSRANRQLHEEIPPPLPGGRRPPIPATTHPARPPVPSVPTKRSSTSESTRKASVGTLQPAPQSSDFVVVEDPQEREEVPPPPPSRTTRPPRSAPPPAPPPPAPSTSSARDMSTSQWELPDIPSSSFDLNVGGGLGLDSSFASEDSTTYPPAAPSPPSTARPTEPPPPPKSVAPPPEVQLSADELLQLWGVVGTAVHSVAASLYDKSKKTVIGDGTSNGFVMAVLAQVPQASKASYGHLVYSQNAHAVLRRSSNIMPGDIIQLTGAKLKGHKGLQSYNQTVGTAQEPLVAIVSEFDTKKSKVKVFQANQHVGAQTVETASYRLEDLKSGNVKVFRVASIQ